MTTNVVTISTTVADKFEGHAMATHLIEGRYAACVQALDITSRFGWKGKMDEKPEVLLLIKTAADRVEPAIAAIKAHHSYELPEILVMPVDGGLEGYLQWVVNETRDKAA